MWYGDLEVLGRAGRKGSNATWFVKCHFKPDGINECGEVFETCGKNLDVIQTCKKCGRIRFSRTMTGKLRYQWTLEQDRIIRDIYEKRSGKYKTYAAYAKVLGYPRHTVATHARRDLGLEPNQKEPNWSAEELKYIYLWSWMTPHMLWLRFQKMGFKRSQTAIRLKYKRLRLHTSRSWLTATELASALGEDGHKVVRWIKRGLLFAHWREYERSERRNGHGHDGSYVIHYKAIRRFMLMNPTEIDLRKVDQYFFFDIITDGNFGENYRDADEERVMKGGRKWGFIETEKNLLLSGKLGSMDDDDMEDGISDLPEPKAQGVINLDEISESGIPF